jgi:aminoglycoside phosphotransferase (APT) family kinase protein
VVRDGSNAAAFPAAEGSRLGWHALPASVLRSLEDTFGARVLEATSQPGGFSPGIAVRVRLSDGRRAFVKAISSSPNPQSPQLHRREAEIANALPPTAPVPKFLFSVDDGDWVALAFEDVGGAHPEVPWRDEELERVLQGISELATALTPSPIDMAPISAETFPFIGWRELRRDAKAQIEPWARRHIAELIELESEWVEAASGETLLHADLRADNILATPNRVVFVDWPHACVGAAWIDLVFFLPSVAMQGGPKPWEVFAEHPLASTAPPERVDASVAALAGYFLWRGSSPPPPGLPGLPAFARAQGEEALSWLRQRLYGHVER